MRSLLVTVLLMIAVPVTAQTVTGNANPATSSTFDSGSISRSFQDRNSDGISIKDFCSAGQSNGSQSAVACINSAIDAACARNPGPARVYFPAGSYLIDGTVGADGSGNPTIFCPGLELAGAGIGDRDQVSGQGTKFIIATGGNNAPAFLAKVTRYNGAPSTTGKFSYGLHIHDMSFWHSSNELSPSRPILDLESWQQAYVDHVYFWSPCTAIRVNGGFEISVSQFIAEGYKDNCSVMSVTGDQSNTTDEVYFSEGKINAGNSMDQGTNYGLNAVCFEIADRVQSVNWKNTQCETTSAALKVSCPTMSDSRLCPGFLNLFNFEAELFPHVGNEVLINLTDVVDGAKIQHGWLRGAVNTSFGNNLIAIQASRFAANTGLPIVIDDMWLKFSGGDCILLNGAPKTTIVNSHIYGCNFYNGALAGVNVQNTPYTLISQNQFGGGDWLQDVYWRMSGIRTDTASHHLVASNNIFSADTNAKANGISAAFVGSLPPQNTTQNNVGP